MHAHPGSRWMFKCWPANRTAGLFERIIADGHSLVVTGAPDPRERALVTAILGDMRAESRARIVDLVGQLTLTELAGVTARARMFVGVDSAPMHIAAAMGTPTLALFGPSGEHEWGPWMVPQRVVVSQAHPCRPCGIDGCGGGKVSECLTTLEVDAVYAQLQSLLAEAAAAIGALMQLAIIRQRYTPFGGAERFVERALAALAARGVELTLMTRSWPRDASPLFSPCIVNPPYAGRLWRDKGFANAVCAAVANSNVSLVQSHERIACCDIYRAGDGLHAVWLDERLRGAGALERFRTRASPYHRYVLDAERRLFASPRLRRVICISRMVRDDIRERHGLADDRLPVIYNAIDSDAFSPRLASERGATRASLGIASDRIVFLLVGSGFERKGVGRAIEALAGVASPAHLLVVGRDRAQARYAALARRNGVGARVTFAGPQLDPRPFYGAADAFVLPTLYDPLSNAVLEALACALPVVTSTRCGAGELVAAHDAGYVCGARDIAAIGDAMQKLCEPSERRRAGANARSAVAKLTPDAMAKELLDLYAAMLDDAADGR